MPNDDRNFDNSASDRAESQERKPPNRPVDTLRDGGLKATIWENKRDEKSNFSLQFRRQYRDAKGNYRDSDSFFAGDLLKLAHLAGRAYDRMNEIQRERYAERDAEREPNRRGARRDSDTHTRGRKNTRTR